MTKPPEQSGDAAATRQSEKGLLFVVATPIGNLEDLSLRGKRVLEEVDCIAAEDTRRTGMLLSRFGISGKRLISFFTGNEKSREDELLERMQGGQSVALVSDAGMPGISDPGQNLVARAHDLGIAVDVIPGPSAALTALIGSGLSSESFYFVGFLSKVASARAKTLAALVSIEATLIFYEAPHRLVKTMEDVAACLGGERAACVCRELTKIHQEYRRGNLDELINHYQQVPPRGEIVFVVEGAVEASATQHDIEAEVRALLGQGLGPKDIATRLVITTGKPKRHLYQLALSLKRQG